MSAIYVPTASARTPSGSWALAAPSPDVKDYFLRVDVDPGETYSVAGTAPASTYFAEYIRYEHADGGYWGIQRSGGEKRVLASLWSASGAKGDTIPAVDCNEFGACSSIKGKYEWKVGHQYRLRIERSPRDARGWWQLTLADLTRGTVDILGELQTPDSWGGLTASNASFLENFWGPYECQTLRHTQATYGPIRGNWGQSTLLANYSASTYDKVGQCDDSYKLPGMQLDDYDADSIKLSSPNDYGKVTSFGNAYRGVHRWGDFGSTAKAGLLFAADPNADSPYIYRALKDGVYGPLPAPGQSNEWWSPVGEGYPIINDLYFRNQTLREWSERNASSVAIGDYFIYKNPYNQDTEYFRLLRKGAGYFPIDRSSNADWEYVGRYAKANEAIANLPLHSWGENGGKGQIGSVFRAANGHYYRLRTSAIYGAFPTSSIDNQDWEYLGDQL